MKIILQSVVLHASILALFGIMFSAGAAAQHNHGRRNTIELEYQTSPADNEVLAVAPDDLLLRFNDYVRLAKLTLKMGDFEFIDIGFAFSPIGNKVFIQPLPTLPKADYYTVEWAVLTFENVMVSGSYRFSFGPGARAPSGIIDARDYPVVPY